MKGRHWTTADLLFLRNTYANSATTNIARHLRRDVSAVYAKANQLGLKKSEAFLAGVASGRIQRGRQSPRMKASQFKPGLVPWNKGTNFLAGGRSAETRFKPGARPHTWVPVGSYRVSSDGQLERKVNDLPGPNHVRWHPVLRLVWEAANGPVPKGHLVVFRPGCKTRVLEEITVDKAECISRAEHARRNHPRSKSPELGYLVALKGAITRQVNRIAREAQERTAP